MLKVHLGIICGLPSLDQLQTHNNICHSVCIDSTSPPSLFLSFPPSPQALVMAEVNGPGPEVPEPQIAMYCGRQLLHMNLQTGQWEPDPQGRQGCFKEPSEILSYCQEVVGFYQHQSGSICPESSNFKILTLMVKVNKKRIQREINKANGQYVKFNYISLNLFVQLC